MPYKDPQERKNYMRDYYLANPEKFRIAGRAYYSNNKDAVRARHKRYRTNNKEKIRAGYQSWFSRNREHQNKKSQNNHLRRKYGITVTEKAILLAKQNNACAICRATKPSQPQGWHTDHCHRTGKFRGILCSHCNRGLGSFKDNPATMIAALDYLMTGGYRE